MAVQRPGKHRKALDPQTKVSLHLVAGDRDIAPRCQSGENREVLGVYPFLHSVGVPVCT